MSLKLRDRNKSRLKNGVLAALSVFAFVVQPMYGVVASQVASAAGGDVIWVDSWGNDSDGCGHTAGGGSHRSDNCKTLQYAVNQANPGDTIKLKTEISYNSAITITKPLTIDGNGQKVDTNIQNVTKDNSNNAGFIIESSDVTIENMRMDGRNGKNIHAINAYHTNGWSSVYNVSVNHYDQSGVNIGENAQIRVTNLTASNIKWDAIDVDKAGSQFSLGGGTSNHFEGLASGVPAIYVDDRDVPAYFHLDNPQIYAYIDNYKTQGDRAYFMASNYPDAIRNLDFIKPKVTINIDKPVNPTAISFDASDNVGLSGFAYAIYTGDNGTHGTRLAQGTGNYIHSGSISGTTYHRDILGNLNNNFDINNLPDGVYTVHVQVLDNSLAQASVALEHRNHTIVDKTFTIDHTAPSVLTVNLDKVRSIDSSHGVVSKDLQSGTSHQGFLKMTVTTDEPLSVGSEVRFAIPAQTSNGNHFHWSNWTAFTKDSTGTNQYSALIDMTNSNADNYGDPITNPDNYYVGKTLSGVTFAIRTTDVLQNHTSVPYKVDSNGDYDPSGSEYYLTIDNEAPIYSNVRLDMIKTIGGVNYTGVLMNNGKLRVTLDADEKMNNGAEVRLEGFPTAVYHQSSTPWVTLKPTGNAGEYSADIDLSQYTTNSGNGSIFNDLNGKFVPDLSLYIRTSDVYNNATTSYLTNPDGSRYKLTLNNTLPSSSLVVPVGTVGNTFTVSGTASDSVGLNRVYVQLVNHTQGLRCGGVTINMLPLGISQAGISNNWSVDYNMSNLLVAQGGVPADTHCIDGVYAATAHVVNVFGVVTQLPWSNDFYVDTTPPTIEYTSGTADDGFVKPGDELTVNFKAHDATRLKSVNVSLYDNQNSNHWVTTCYNNGAVDKADINGSCTLKIPANLKDGVYTLKGDASDYGGHWAWSKAIRTFTVDTEKPTITLRQIQTIKNSGDWFTPKQAIRIQPKDENLGKLFVNSVELPQYYGSTSFKIEWYINQHPETDTFVFTSEDQAGNMSDDYVVKVDRNDPVALTINIPTANQFFNHSNILNSWSSAIDNESGVGHYEIAYKYDDGHTFGNNTDWTTIPNIDGSTGGVTRYTSTGANTSRTHKPNLTTEQGGVTIWVRAVDNVGNVGEWSAPVHYTVDSIAPVVSFDSSLVDGATYTGDVDLIASISDANLSHYYLTITKDGSNYDVAGLTQKLIYTGEFTDETLTTLTEDGHYTVKLEARDKADNKDGTPATDGDSVKTVSFTIDTTGPVITGDETGVVTGAGTIQPALTDEDGDASQTGNKYAWVDDSSNPDTDGNVISDPSVLNPLFRVTVEGDYKFTLTATDPAGNVTTKVFSFTYTKPVVDDNQNGGAQLPAGGTGTPADDGFTNVVVADGDVQGASTENGDVNTDDGGSTAKQDGVKGASTHKDDGCSKFLGICWYYWIPVVIVVIALEEFTRRKLKAHRANA